MRGRFVSELLGKMLITRIFYFSITAVVIGSR